MVNSQLEKYVNIRLIHLFTKMTKLLNGVEFIQKPAYRNEDGTTLRPVDFDDFQLSCYITK